MEKKRENEMNTGLCRRLQGAGLSCWLFIDHRGIEAHFETALLLGGVIGNRITTTTPEANKQHRNHPPPSLTANSRFHVVFHYP